jgi:hypothetical protein
LENLVSTFLSDSLPLGSNEVGVAVGISEDKTFDSENRESFTTSASKEPDKSQGLTAEAPRLRETEDGQVNYIDRSHWQAILEDIKEVREHLTLPTVQSSPDYQTDFSENYLNLDPGLIFGSTSATQLAEILVSLPPQPICDMLLSTYFNSRFMVLGMILIETVRG